MKVKFKTIELEAIYQYGTEGEGKQKFSKQVIKQYQRKVDILIEIDNITKLRQFRGLNFEKLKGDKKGEYSIRINKQFRLLFEQVKSEEHKITINILLINEISKHYE